ncbi:hypothetical protein NN6n1_20790 [Shinella zoogloeoides]
MLAPVGLVAREEDLVMRPLDGGDAVHLHEADIVDELQQPRLAEKAAGRGAEALSGEEDAPGFGIGEKNRHGRMIGIYSWFVPPVCS